MISAALVIAAAPTIGTISSTGRFHIDGAEVWNQSSLFEGAAVHTNAAASRLLFRNGTDLRLGASAQSRVYANRLVLENGALEGLLPQTFHVEAGSLGLRVEGVNSRAHISVKDGAVIVASLHGPVSVRGSQGLLLASLQEGNSVQLLATSGAKAGAQLTGVVEHHDKAYFLTDEVTGLRVEIRGMHVAKQVGQRVTVVGEVDPGVTAAGRAQHVVRVTRFETPAAGSTAAGAGGSGAGLGGSAAGAGSASGAGGGAAAGVGIGALAKTTIIAGVAIAGATTTGLVVANRDDKKPTASPEP